MKQLNVLMDTEIKPCKICNTHTALRCIGCHNAIYCSKICQKKDWSTHKFECMNRLDTFITFVTQACIGPVMATFREGLLIDDSNYVSTLKHLLAHYLNTVWMSILKDDDIYISSTFASLRHSPKCLINIAYVIGCIVLPESPPDFTKLKLYNKNEQFLSSVRNSMFLIFSESIKNTIGTKLQHKCEGDSIQSIRKKWISEGCKDDRFFILN